MDVMAPRTERRLTRDLMLLAVPYSSLNILFTRDIWSPGGMIRDIIEVPFPRAACKFLISFFTLNISICLSVSSCSFDDMVLDWMFDVCS